MAPCASKQEEQPTEDYAVQADEGHRHTINGNLNLLMFFDKREVNMLTPAHGDAKFATGHTNPVTKEPIIKLQAVHEHNMNIVHKNSAVKKLTHKLFCRELAKQLMAMVPALPVRYRYAKWRVPFRASRADLSTQLCSDLSSHLF